MVREATDKMENITQMLTFHMPASERHEPVQVLVGDCGLPKHIAELAVAHLLPMDPTRASDVWQVLTTAHGLTGDLCFVKGCAVDELEIAVGHSYAERGMRRDCHDAVGVVLRLPLLHATRLAHVAELDDHAPPQIAPGDDDTAETSPVEESAGVKVEKTSPHKEHRSKHEAMKCF